MALNYTDPGITITVRPFITALLTTNRFPPQSFKAAIFRLYIDSGNPDSIKAWLYDGQVAIAATLPRYTHHLAHQGVLRYGSILHSNDWDLRKGTYDVSPPADPHSDTGMGDRGNGFVMRYRRGDGGVGVRWIPRVGEAPDGVWYIEVREMEVDVPRMGTEGMVWRDGVGLETTMEGRLETGVGSGAGINIKVSEGTQRFARSRMSANLPVVVSSASQSPTRTPPRQKSYPMFSGPVTPPPSMVAKSAWDMKRVLLGNLDKTRHNTKGDFLVVILGKRKQVKHEKDDWYVWDSTSPPESREDLPPSRRKTILSVWRDREDFQPAPGTIVALWDLTINKDWEEDGDRMRRKNRYDGIGTINAFQKQYDHDKVWFTIEPRLVKGYRELKTWWETKGRAEWERMEMEREEMELERLVRENPGLGDNWAV